jgi:hypothetical protein
MKPANFPRLIVLLLLAVSLAACSNYRTIGAGPEGVKIPTTASGSKDQPAKPQAGQGIQRQPTLGKDAVLCRLSDLTPTATWNVGNESLVGTLTLTNYWPVACLLRGHPLLGLTDDKGQDYPLQVTAPTASPEPPVWELKENTTVEIRFTWTNWCGPTPNGAVRVTVANASANEPVLFVTVQDENGSPRADAPPCKHEKAPSILVEESLRIK